MYLTPSYAVLLSKKPQNCKIQTLDGKADMILEMQVQNAKPEIERK